MKVVRYALRAAFLAFLLTGSVILAHAQQAPPVAPGKPSIYREDIEWLDIWVPDTHVTNVPRVLLIGDSVTRAYYPDAEKALRGKAVVARLATSKSAGDPVFIEEVTLLLKQYHFDVIHFNNGIHGQHYSEEAYSSGIRDLIAAFEKCAPGAKLIWATSTPLRESGHLDRLDADNARIVRRNADSLAIMKQRGIPVDDLYALVLDYPEYYAQDGTHFNEKGVKVEGAEVARQIIALLP